MKIDSKSPKHWILLFQQGIYTLFAIGVRYLRKKPEKPIVILYGHQFSGNIKALYTEWARSRENEIDLFFLSLDPDYSADLERAGIQVLRCNRVKDMLKLSQASAMITDHGLHLMTPLLRFTDIIFIDVWHGIPFKGLVPEDFDLQHGYNEIWVSSPLMKSIYEARFGFRPERVRSLGYARTDRLFVNDGPGPEFRTETGIPAGNKIVLYAPTWQQDDCGRELFPFRENAESFIGLLSQVCRIHSATLVIRSHLNASILNGLHDDVIYCSQKDFPDTEDLLLATDVLICDWSSIAFDYLALNRPTLFLDVDPPFRNGFSLGKEYRFGKVIGDMASLGDALSHYLQRPDDYLREQGEAHADILANVYGENTDGLVCSRQLERLSMLTGDNPQ